MIQKAKRKDELTRRLIVTCPSAWMFSLSRKHVSVVLINGLDRRDVLTLLVSTYIRHNTRYTTSTKYFCYPALVILLLLSRSRGDCSTHPLQPRCRFHSTENAQPWPISLFPCIALLNELAQPFSASPSRDNGGDAVMVETKTPCHFGSFSQDSGVRTREIFPCQDRCFVLGAKLKVSTSVKQTFHGKVKIRYDLSLHTFG